MTEQNHNLDFAQKFQQQFEFYFVGLVFTLLGLAVQTGKSTSHIWSGYFEFGGWLCLMLCGILFLHRLAMVPTLIRMQVELSRVTEELGQLRIDLKNGHPTDTPVPSESDLELTLGQAIEQHAESKKQLEANVRMSQARNVCKYRIGEVSFLLALLCLMISRGAVIFLS